MSTTAEKVIGIAGQLYEMRRLLRSVLGDDKFRQKVEAMRPLFEQVQKANNCTTVQAMQMLLKTETVGGDPHAMIQVCAVAVEIMEPSLPATAGEAQHPTPTTLI